MSYEVIERSTGAAMSHRSAKAGDIMGTTLFLTEWQAIRWMAEQGIDKTTHDVRPAHQEGKD